MTDGFICVAQTQTPPPAPKTKKSESGGLTDMLVGMGPILILVVMVVFLFRAQRKESKRREEMIGELKKGDKIVTAGGIYGVITNVKEKSFMIKIADNVKIEVAKNGVNVAATNNQTEDKG